MNWERVRKLFCVAWSILLFELKLARHGPKYKLCILCYQCLFSTTVNRCCIYLRATKMFTVFAISYPSRLSIPFIAWRNGIAFVVYYKPNKIWYLVRKTIGIFNMIDKLRSSSVTHITCSSRTMCSLWWTGTEQTQPVFCGDKPIGVLVSKE